MPKKQNDGASPSKEALKKILFEVNVRIMERVAEIARDPNRTINDIADDEAIRMIVEEAVERAC
jgi:hypothetical protein